MDGRPTSLDLVWIRADHGSALSILLKITYIDKFIPGVLPMERKVVTGILEEPAMQKAGIETKVTLIMPQKRL